MLKTINQVIVFLLEMAMLVTYGYYGMTRPWNLALKLLFTFLILAAAIGLWSVFAAPKSGQRLEMPYLALFRAGMFLTAAFLLFQCGHRNTALIFAVIILITQAVSWFTE